MRIWMRLIGLALLKARRPKYLQMETIDIIDKEGAEKESQLL